MPLTKDEAPSNRNGETPTPSLDAVAGAESPLDVLIVEKELTQELLPDRRFDRQFLEFCNEIHFEPSMATTPSTVAAEYQRLFQPDRTWVLLRSGTGWRVKAVGGIPGFQRRAEVVRKLEALIKRIGRTNERFQWTAGGQDGNLSPQLKRTLDQYLDEAHICRLRAEPLSAYDSRTLSDAVDSLRPPLGIVVCEWFQPAQDFVPESYWTAARQQSGLAIQNAADWSRAPLAQRLRRSRRTSSWKFIVGWGGVLVLSSIGLATAALIPIEFTVDARGELQPVRRRNVFASTAGIVRTLAVSSGDEVSEGARLLELDSPDLELELRRVEGELGTTDKRIMSIETSRLDFGISSPDSANQMNSLAGELKELRQKRDNLVHEIELLSLRQEELKVISPITGRVVTWDLERLLSRRPVSRGQRLLTISDTEGPWELSLRIADEDTSDLYAAMKENESVDIDFVVITMPEQVYSTTLQSVSDTIEIRSTGDSPTLLCRASVPETLARQAVEGMSVRGRIKCGRRPAVTVVFDKLWRVIKEYVLFPWGF